MKYIASKIECVPFLVGMEYLDQFQLFEYKYEILSPLFFLLFPELKSKHINYNIQKKKLTNMNKILTCSIDVLVTTFSLLYFTLLVFKKSICSNS